MGIGRHEALQQEDYSSSVPVWLKAMFDSKFFNACLSHSELKKNELNYFCIDCVCSMCSHCLPDHLDHIYIQIRRYMYHDVINMQDLRKLFNYSGIQTYSTNGAKVVFLKERPSTHAKVQQHSTSREYHCVNCERSLQDSSLYCSILCKVSVTYKDTIVTMCDQHVKKEDLLNTEKEKEKEDAASLYKKQRRLKRKGYPHRSPLF